MVVLLDQRRLPDEEVELECRSVAEVVVAIRELAIRGAPAIGVAAAYALALAAARGEDLDEAAAVLAASRPTAVNVVWALGRDARRSVPCSAPARSTRRKSSAVAPWLRMRPSCLLRGRVR